jgi:hypothetical protein
MPWTVPISEATRATKRGHERWRAFVVGCRDRETDGAR